MKLSGFALVAALAVALVAGEQPCMKESNNAIAAGQEQGKVLNENEGRALRGLEETQDVNEDFENYEAPEEQRRGGCNPRSWDWPRCRYGGGGGCFPGSRFWPRCHRGGW